MLAFDALASLPIADDGIPAAVVVTPITVQIGGSNSLGALQGGGNVLAANSGGGGTLASPTGGGNALSSTIGGNQPLQGT